jgi:hypothetical protein
VADALGLGWAMWDWKAGFHYWQENGESGAPDPPEMREALFPGPRLQSSLPGHVEIEGALGKAYVLHRAPDPAIPGSWLPVSTQLLLTPRQVFVDSEAGSHSAAFYRAEWLKAP